MTTVDQLFAAAAQRKADSQLPYPGALSPSESFELLQQVPAARLVDVRTRAELDWVGRPLVEATQYAHIEWNVYPGGTRNPGFLESLREVAEFDTPILLLCRSAVRSKAAAELAAQAGYTKVFDVLEGFEGNKNAEGHRKSVGGWCWHGLPWIGA
jgi:rhodanese-related sulfurtransferase